MRRALKALAMLLLVVALMLVSYLLAFADPIPCPGNC